MRLRRVHNVALLFVAVLAGCGGGGSSGGGGAAPPNPPSSAGTSIAVTFTGTNQPTAIAVSIGGAAFTPKTASGGTVTFTLPTGTSTYQLAYHCPVVNAFGLADDEYVVSANKSDGTFFSLACYGNTATTTSVAVTANATAIASATDIALRGTLGYGGNIGSANGTANIAFDNGTNDIAALALTSSGAVAAAKFIRAQAIPGTVAPITFAATDATTTAIMTVSAIPAGFNPVPAYAIEYQTASGTSFLLNVPSSPTIPNTFAVIPPANMAAGDTYEFASNNADQATNQHIGATAYSATGAPITVTMPMPWTYTGPTAAQYPTFTFVYGGFPGSPVLTYTGSIFWTENATTEAGIFVYATPAYLGTATTLQVPNLSSLTGFIASPASGTVISATSEIDGASALTFLQKVQTSGNEYYVQNGSTYTEP